jgi:Flp pilus assembly protein TadB
MNQRPTPPEPMKALLQAHGLNQPSAAFSESLTQLVIARYVPPRVEPFRAGIWLGNAILLVLAGLLVLVTYAVPIVVSGILATSLAAMVIGTGSLIWLLEHYRKRLFQQATGC